MPLVAGDLAILSSDDRRPDGIGHIYAIQASSGSVQWKTRIGRGSLGDVARLDAHLYTVTLDNELVALDLANGKRVWSFRAAPALDPELNLLATPAVGSGRAYFGGADGVIYALSADSGAPLWKSKIGSPIVTPLVLISDALYFGTRDGRLLRADRSDGRITGERRLSQMPFGPPIAAGKSLLAYSAEGDSLVLNAFDMSLTALRWSRRAPQGWSSSRPCLWQGSVLVGSAAGELAALAIEDGKVNWTRQLKGVIRGIGYDAELVFVGTLKGTLFAVKPPAGKR